MREGNEEGLKARQNCRKQISGGRFESPLKHRKSGKTSTMMPLAKKGVCVFFLNIFRKKAYALFGQPSNLERQISATKKSRFPSVKRAVLNKVSKPEMQDRPWRNGSIATLMGGR